MSEARSRPPVDWEAVRRRIAAGARRVLLAGVRRGYALTLIVVILWTSYQAISYLVVSLFRSPDTPAQVRDIPRRLDEQFLHGQRPDWLGLAAVENPRTPPGHYHRFDNWLPNDQFNDCTRSGCHAPLPHAVHKETRAFLNMHTTVLHCGVCHVREQQTPLPLTWYRLDDGEIGPPPLLLSTYRELLELDATTPIPPERVRAAARNLRTAANGDAALQRAADHLEAVHPAATRFPAALLAAREIVARNFRASYGAKLALRLDNGRPRLGHPDPVATRTLLDLPADADAATRAAAVKAAHLLKREEPLDCAACHAADATTIDFAAVGYPEARRAALNDPIVVRMIENIAAGRPFHLPGASAPATDE